MAFTITFSRPAQRRRFYPSRCCDFLEPMLWTSAVVPRDDTDDFSNFLQALIGRNESQNNANKQVEVTHDESEHKKQSFPEKYAMNIDVQDFAPEDIKVKVQGDNLIVEAKQEVKKEEEGMFFHSFKELRRTLEIPNGVDKKNITSAYSSGGILEIEGSFLPPSITEDPEEKTELDIERSDE
ncbi:body wall muscle protein HR-29-like [Styela clava]